MVDRESLVEAIRVAISRLRDSSSALWDGIRPKRFVFLSGPCRVEWPAVRSGRTSWECIDMERYGVASLEDDDLPSFLAELVGYRPNAVLCLVSRINMAIEWCSKRGRR